MAKSPWIAEADGHMDHGYCRLRVEWSGFSRCMGAERTPAYIGFVCLAMMGFLALYGQWGALKGVWLWALWHGICVLMYRRDPQYWAILWDKEWVVSVAIEASRQRRGCVREGAD